MPQHADVLHPETQAKILSRFHFALAPRGLLFLGKAEMLLSHGRLFDPVGLKRRMFRKVPNTPVAASGFLAPSAALERRAEVGGLDDLRDKAFTTSPVAQIAVTMDETVALINHQAETMFGLTSRDVGRPLRDLGVSYRPVELRGYLEQARAERRPIRIKEVTWQRPGAEAVWLDIQVNPVITRENRLLGVAVVFHDVSAARRLLKELEHALRREEADGQHLLNLDIGLPLSQLRPLVRSALGDAAYAHTETLSAVNRRGRDIQVRVVCGALRQSDGNSGGAILVMDVIPENGAGVAAGPRTGTSTGEVG